MMRTTRRATVFLACGMACVLMLRAQEPIPDQGTFRGGIDAIELDVSVFDKDGRPIRGLTAADFTVLENGKPQRIVTIAEVDAAERDPSPSAWIRHVPRDVTTNDFTDQGAEGRLFAIVLDDAVIPSDAHDIIMSARAIARYIIDQLGPSDLAAVVYAEDTSLTQDFTDDRAKLLAAVDAFQPKSEFIQETPRGAGPIGGDMRRSSPVLARSTCWRLHPGVPALATVTSRLATAPKKRKTIFYVGFGVPEAVPQSGGGCPASLAAAMLDLYRVAQRANVNIHSIDPAGLSYNAYLSQHTLFSRRSIAEDAQRPVPTSLRKSHEFLQWASDSTGGRAIWGTDDLEPAVDEIFEDYGAYYLIGYETSNPTADGKFRKLEVKVNRPGASTRTRSGFWAPTATEVVNPRDNAAPATSDLGLNGMMSPQSIPMRVLAVPLGRAETAGAGPRDADVALILTLRLPPLRAAMTETVSIIRNIYDEDGRTGPPVQETRQVSLAPGGGDGTLYDVTQRLPLAPGRYQVRMNATSAVLKKSASVYAEFEVPDFTRSTLGTSSIVLGRPATDAAPQDERLIGRIPLVPTTVRDFAASDRLDAFLRVFQATSPLAVTVTTKIFDTRDVSLHEETTTLPAEAFADGRGADLQVQLPLAGLARGPYVLSMSLQKAGAATVRRDLVFRIR